MENIDATESCFIQDVPFNDIIVFESELVKNNIWFEVIQDELSSEEYGRKYVLLKINSSQVNNILQDNKIQRNVSILNGKATKVFLLTSCAVGFIMLIIILMDYLFKK